MVEEARGIETAEEETPACSGEAQKVEESLLPRTHHSGCCFGEIERARYPWDSPSSGSLV